MAVDGGIRGTGKPSPRGSDSRHRFQGDHYDLPPWLRSRAVELGAEEVPTAELLVRMAARAATAPAPRSAHRRVRRDDRAALLRRLREPSDAAWIFVRPTEDVAPLELIPGLRFQPVTADSVMDELRHFRGPARCRDATITSSSRSRSVRLGRADVHRRHRDPRHAPGATWSHPAARPARGIAGPEGCVAIDVFTPPARASRGRWTERPPPAMTP